MGEHDRVRGVFQAVDDAVDATRAGDVDAAIDRFQDAFGSECGDATPATTTHDADWRSDCIRHDAAYESVHETMAERDHAPRRDDRVDPPNQS